SFYCFKNEDIELICNELSIIPRFGYPTIQGKKERFPQSFFQGIFRYRYRISTEIALRRYLYSIYGSAIRNNLNKFEPINSSYNFNSFLSVAILKTFLGNEWINDFFTYIKNESGLA
ncbi:MAG: hypothetical protein D6734_07905, partial [Candidatus Schekmanbacteria bacterium]